MEKKFKKKISFWAQQKLRLGANTQMGRDGGGAAATRSALPMLSNLLDYNTPRFPLPGGAAYAKGHFFQLLPNPNRCRASKKKKSITGTWHEGQQAGSAGRPRPRFLGSTPAGFAGGQLEAAANEGSSKQHLTRTGHVALHLASPCGGAEGREVAVLTVPVAQRGRRDFNTAPLQEGCNAA